MSQFQSILRNILDFLRQNAEWVMISLILGFVIWIVAALDDDPVQQRTLAQNIRIEFIEGEEVVRSSNLTRTTAEITLLAPRSTFEEITTDDIRLTADLSSLPPGRHDIKLEAEIINDDLRGRVVEIDPEEVSIDVVAVGERLIQVTPRISPSATRATAICEPNEIRVSGPLPVVNSISVAEARIDVSDQTATASGNYSIILFDDNDRPITTLTTDPSTVACTVEVEQRDDAVTVEVVPDVIGDPPEGFLAVQDYETDPSEIEVTGDPDALDALGGEIMTEEISLEGQTETFSRVVGVVLPEGIQLVQSTQRITVTITITEPNTTINFDDVQIQVINLGGGLDVELSPETVSVSITGRRSLLQDLKIEDISISVDVADLGVGSHEGLELTHEFLRESLQDPQIPVIIQPSEVDVTITERIVPTPTPLGIIG